MVPFISWFTPSVPPAADSRTAAGVAGPESSLLPLRLQISRKPESGVDLGLKPRPVMPTTVPNVSLTVYMTHSLQYCYTVLAYLYRYLLGALFFLHI